MENNIFIFFRNWLYGFLTNRELRFHFIHHNESKEETLSINCPLANRKRHHHTQSWDPLDEVYELAVKARVRTRFDWPLANWTSLYMLRGNLFVLHYIDRIEIRVTVYRVQQNTVTSKRRRMIIVHVGFCRQCGSTWLVVQRWNG
jgi:hypothetical protein